MRQATNADPIEIVGHEFGRFVMDAERAKNRTNTRLDRVALMVLGTLKERGAVRLTLLADCTGFDASTVSRQVTELEKNGLLKRTTDPEDRRAALLEVTPAGNSLMRRLIDGRRRRLERLLSDWTPAEIATLGAMLHKLNESTAKHGDELRRDFEQELNNG